jgi:hypothetical protein
VAEARGRRTTAQPIFIIAFDLCVSANPDPFETSSKPCDRDHVANSLTNSVAKSVPFRRSAASCVPASHVARVEPTGPAFGRPDDKLGETRGQRRHAERMIPDFAELSSGRPTGSGRSLPSVRPEAGLGGPARWQAPAGPGGSIRATTLPRMGGRIGRGPSPVMISLARVQLTGSPYAAAANSMPTSSAREDVTEPKIPPWALTIFSPMSWNSGK